VPESSAYEVEVAIEIGRCINIQVMISFQQNDSNRRKTLHSEIHKLKLIWDKGELQQQWKK
jgi:hypothetical protein